MIGIVIVAECLEHGNNHHVLAIRNDIDLVAVDGGAVPRERVKRVVRGTAAKVVEVVRTVP